MIVDSPGIGESDVMSEFVLNYLSRAFCFMYVINSENAGGVQEDRVSENYTEDYICQTYSTDSNHAFGQYLCSKRSLPQ